MSDKHWTGSMGGDGPRRIDALEDVVSALVTAHQEIKRLRAAMGEADLALEVCWQHTNMPDDVCTCGASNAQDILHAALIEQKP